MLAKISHRTVEAVEAGQLGTAGTLERHLAALGLELRAVRVRK